jgi:hypothetical protein
VCSPFYSKGHIHLAPANTKTNGITGEEMTMKHPKKEGGMSREVLNRKATERDKVRTKEESF